MKRFLMLAVVIVIAIVFLGPAGSVQAGAGGGGSGSRNNFPPGYIGNNGAHNRDGSKVIPNRGPVSARDRQIMAQKLALADKHAQMKQGNLDPQTYWREYIQFLNSIGESAAAARVSNDTATRSWTTASTSTAYSGHWLGLAQVAQTNSYYCGPASAYEILATLGYRTSHDGEALSQAKLATTKYLETDKWGQTPWYVSSVDQPYPQTLNYWRTSNYAGFYGLSSSSFSAGTFQSNFTSDIDAGWPVAGDGWEVAGANNPHFVGHPTNVDIFHWVAIYGYGNYGSTTSYADSVHNATSISWYSGVPAYSDLPTTTVATILNGRGYVW